MRTLEFGVVRTFVAFTERGGVRRGPGGYISSVISKQTE
jgi:hypothetical protein